MTVSKWAFLNKDIMELSKSSESPTEIAESLFKTHADYIKSQRHLTPSVNAIRKYVESFLKNPPAEIETPAPSVESMDDRVKSLFKKKDVYTLEELSDKLDAGIGRVRQSVEAMIAQGVNFKVDGVYVIFSNQLQKSESRTIEATKTPAGFYRFGVTGDNHLCSRYERLDVLESLHNRFEQEGIETVYNTGNWIDGEARFNKHDLKVHGMDGQIDYFIKHYPSRSGITTHYITGDDHEGWYTQREGVNIGAYTEMKAKLAGRRDLVFLGHMEADVIIKAPNGETKIRVLHPGGGSSYAISYTSQKIVESYTGNEKPDILLDGHYHKAGYNYIRGVHVCQTGCTQDQTPFMRKKRLAAHLGGWIIEFAVDESGAITRFKQEFLPYYDNEYHTKWGYQW
jgi:predicted phosphodiesterase